jgi:hypothetical protein
LVVRTAVARINSDGESMTPPASQHDLAHARGHGSASELEHDDLSPNRQ